MYKNSTIYPETIELTESTKEKTSAKIISYYLETIDLTESTREKTSTKKTSFNNVSNNYSIPEDSSENISVFSNDYEKIIFDNKFSAFSDFSFNIEINNPLNDNNSNILSDLYLNVVESRNSFSDSNITDFSVYKIRKFRKIGKFNDVYSRNKCINNQKILNFTKKYLDNEFITAMILDGPCLRTTNKILTLNNLKRLTIIEGIDKHYKIMQNKLKILQKKNRKTILKIYFNNINLHLKKKFIKDTNLIYLDINSNFFKLSGEYEGAKYTVKKILKNLRVKRIIFAMTFCLRNSIKDFKHSTHCKKINDKLDDYFRQFGYDYLSLVNEKDNLYRGNSGFGNLYFNIFLLEKINLIY